MTTVTMSISDVQRSLKEKVLPVVEQGGEILVEDAKSHEKKFRIVPVTKQAADWPDFLSRAQAIGDGAPLSEALLRDRERY
jgi:hypothetical protein